MRSPKTDSQLSPNATKNLQIDSENLGKNFAIKYCFLVIIAYKYSKLRYEKKSYHFDLEKWGIFLIPTEELF